MTDSAKLELLTRSSTTGAFQIVELDSRRAYWAYKPRRLPPTEWELTPQPKGADGARQFVLKNLREQTYLLLSEREHFLWEYFDGRHSLEEIARAFHLAFGAFDYAVIRHLLKKLYQCGFLERQRLLDVQPRLASGRDPRWTGRCLERVKKWRAMCFRIPDADRFCSMLYRRGGFLLFHPVTFWLSLAVAVLAFALAVRLSQNSASFAYFIKAQPFLIGAVSLITLLVASMLHVLVHALACKAHGRHVREIGFFLLHGLVPTFYADVTDIFMANRRARIIVDCAGPMVELVLGSVAILTAYTMPAGIEQTLLIGIAVLLWEGALINLYPFNFLEMDGYNVLADLLAVPMLREQALALLPNLPERLRRLKSTERAEWLQLGYLALCLISVLVYLAAHLDALRALIHFL